MSEMLPAGDPVPSRIGDDERDEAVAALQTHMSKGRLTAAEFDERVSAALAARTDADLCGLFADLPAPRPGLRTRGNSGPDLPPVSNDGATVERRKPHLYTFLIAAGVIWSAFLVYLFLTSGKFWWTGFFVAGATGALARYCGLSDGEKEQQEG